MTEGDSPRDYVFQKMRERFWNAVRGPTLPTSFRSTAVLDGAWSRNVMAG